MLLYYLPLFQIYSDCWIARVKFWTFFVPFCAILLGRHLSDEAQPKTVGTTTWYTTVFIAVFHFFQLYHSITTARVLCKRTTLYYSNCCENILKLLIIILILLLSYGTCIDCVRVGGYIDSTALRGNSF
jgi:hypothetical protein